MLRHRLTQLAALACAGIAFPAFGQISGSAHDFSSMAWADGEICKPCHTPHHSITEVGRLWNHELTTATYEMHAGSGTAELDFDLASRLCLSCHDGTVALDSFGGQSGTSFIGGDQNLGTDLTNDHPVGSDAEYPPEDKPSWWDGSMKDKATFPSSVRLKKWTSKHTGNSIDVVSCTTCHNVHNRYNHDYLLTLDNSASALCLTCHIK
jgi:predicted CXXCH cytochrome family protein